MKLEVGKKYLTRSGEVALIKTRHEDDRDYPFRGEVDGNFRTWKEDGKHSLQKESKYDLLELTNPKTRQQLVTEADGSWRLIEPPKFKPQDFVMVGEKVYKFYSYQSNGTEAVVLADSGYATFSLDKLKKVTPKPATHEHVTQMVYVGGYSSPQRLDSIIGHYCTRKDIALLVDSDGDMFYAPLDEVRVFEPVV